MTQEEIFEYNKRCAEFLGAEFSSNDWRYTFQKELMDTEYTLRKSKRHHQEQMCFHSDWNWIMEVVEAIEKLKMEVYIIDEECSIIDIEKAEKDPFMIQPVSFGEGKSKKEAVVQAINQFLIWYNENKTN